MLRKKQPAPAPTPAREVVKVVRLTAEVYEHLRREANGTCIVTATTTELQAGFQLGVNHVLNIISKGFTIEAP